MLTATLFSTVNVGWVDDRGRERDCDVEVDYTFDSDELKITGTSLIGSASGIGEYEFDELVWEAVNAVADEAYGEWLADRGDYMADMRADRAAESYIPAGSAAA